MDWKSWVWHIGNQKVNCMSKNIYIILLSFFWNMGCSQTEITVMTYNIRLDHAGDDEDNWHHRKEEMVKYLLEKSPDFIGIQEALVHQLKYLDSALVDYQYIGVGRDDGKEKGEFMAILYRSDDWKLKEDSTVWLSDTPAVPTMGWDAACHRTCTFGEFRHRSGKEVAILNTHFDHAGNEARLNSPAVIEALVNSIGADIPVILTGDFNVEPNHEAYQELSTFLTEASELADVVKRPYKGTFNGFKLEEDYLRRIDFIFTNNVGLSIKDYVVETPLTSEGRHVSDHFPVIIEARMK